MPGVRFHVTPSLAAVQFLIELFNFLPGCVPRPLSRPSFADAESSFRGFAVASGARGFRTLGEDPRWHWTRDIFIKPVASPSSPFAVIFEDGTDFRLWAATLAFSTRATWQPAFLYRIPESVYITWFTQYSGWISSVINRHRVLSILPVPPNFSGKISTTKILTSTRRSDTVLRVFGISSLNY